MNATLEMPGMIDTAEQFSCIATVTDEDYDRDGDRVSIDGISTKNFEAAGGVVLWAHNNASIPVGSVYDKDGKFCVWREGSRLRAKIHFDNSPEAQRVADAVRKKICLGVSIAFCPIRYEKNDKGGNDFLAIDWTELSITPTPANPRAVIDKHYSKDAQYARMSDPAAAAQLLKKARLGGRITSRLSPATLRAVGDSVNRMLSRVGKSTQADIEHGVGAGTVDLTGDGHVATLSKHMSGVHKFLTHHLDSGLFGAEGEPEGLAYDMKKHHENLGMFSSGTDHVADEINSRYGEPVSDAETDALIDSYRNSGRMGS